MEKKALLSIIEQIDQKVIDYDNKYAINKPFLSYRQIDWGYRIFDTDNYKLWFGLHSDSKKIKNFILKIIWQLGISEDEIIFERIFLKRLKPHFLGNIRIGSSVSSKRKTTGTIGMFVHNSSSEPGFITAGHILNEANSDKSFKVFSPGKAFQTKGDRSSIIGHVEQTIVPQKHSINELDVAHAVTKGYSDLMYNNIIDIGKFKGKKLNVISKDKEIPSNTIVYKIGTKSLLKYGIYGGVANLASVGNYRFKDVHTIKETVQNLAILSDSGGPAFIEDSDELFCIGIVFACVVNRVGKSNVAQSTVLVCPIDKILENLNVQPF